MVSTRFNTLAAIVCALCVCLMAYSCKQDRIPVVIENSHNSSDDSSEEQDNPIPAADEGIVFECSPTSYNYKSYEGCDDYFTYTTAESEGRLFKIKRILRYIYDPYKSVYNFDTILFDGYEDKNKYSFVDSFQTDDIIVEKVVNEYSFHVKISPITTKIDYQYMIVVGNGTFNGTCSFFSDSRP